MAAMTVSIVLACWAMLERLVRTKTEEELDKAYVLCAVCSGAGTGRILFRHILPNIMGEALRYLALTCADMVMMITGLSFVGVSMGTDIIDWGAMITDGRAQLSLHPLLVWVPALGIVLTTFALYLLSEQLERRRTA